MYTKRFLLKHFPSQNAIATFLGIKHQAVYSWPMDKPIPALRQYQLRDAEKKWMRRVNGR